MEPAKRNATYQDVLDAPEHVNAEIIDGDLYLSPRPGGPHTRAASLLAGELIPPFDRGKQGPGGWIILVEPELHLGKQIVIPDLAGWRRERLPVIPNEAYFTLAPDWICEFLSRSTEKLDRGRKLRVYAKAGVKHAWLINARRRTLEVYRLVDGGWFLVDVHTDDDRFRAEPFEAIELELGAIWADIAAPPSRASEGTSEYAEHWDE